MHIKPYLLIGCLCGTLSVQAQSTLTLTPTAMGPLQYTTFYSPYASYVRQDFTFPTPAVSLANYGGGIQLTFSAPAGYAWRCEAGPLEVYLSYGAPPTPLPGLIMGGYDPTINFVPGMGCTLPDQFYVAWREWGSETSFGFDRTISFPSAVEFTDLTIRLGQPMDAYTLPAYQNQLPLSSFNEAYFEFYGSGATPMSLVPVPEPSFAALTALGSSLLVYMRASGRRIRHRPEA